MDWPAGDSHVESFIPNEYISSSKIKCFTLKLKSQTGV